MFRVNRAKATTEAQGTIETVATFPNDGSAGEAPSAGLVQAADGSFYGTAEFGGENFAGTIFRVANGAVAAVHSFNMTDGANPASPLLIRGNSLYGTTTGYIRFGESPYKNREPYDAHSPITHVRNLKTPILLLHGQNDRAVPVAQAQEFHHAATEQGVEAELVIYPGAAHGISKGTHRVDIQARVLDWFDRHLK